MLSVFITYSKLIPILQRRNPCIRQIGILSKWLQTTERFKRWTKDSPCRLWFHFLCGDVALVSEIKISFRFPTKTFKVLQLKHTFRDYLLQYQSRNSKNCHPNGHLCSFHQQPSFASLSVR